MTPRCARVVDDSGQSAPFARVCVVKTLVLRVLFVCVFWNSILYPHFLTIVYIWIGVKKLREVRPTVLR